ncbi:MAG: D-2-hydroxyacid dehydrogenase [Burkholderiales bacterium]|nr:D-2-hydroxyacid dehydrogenase [Burkholderiales bacterium]
MTAVQIPCPKPIDELKLLVHHHLAPMYLHEIRTGFPTLRIAVLDNFVDLPATLAREQPDAVLSFRMGHLGAFPREILLSWPSIRWLHATGAGIEHLPPWDASRIMVTNSSGLHGSVMAEYAAWAILNQTQRMPTFAKQQREHVWKLYPVDSAGGKTVAIVGMGRVGREIAARLRPFGMRIIGVRNRAGSLAEADETLPAERLPEALARADFVILVTPLTTQTRGLFSARMLAYCKAGAYFINMARGNIVDEAALRDAIASGALKGATMDVFHTEPLPPEDPMWDTQGIIATPHVSGEVADWQRMAARLFIDNLGRWLRREPLRNLCDPALGY